MMGYEICVQQFAFTKRCWWQLSSIAQQKSPPPLTFKLNIHRDDPFHELNLKLIKTFSGLLDLRVKIWDNDRFYKRGDVRNDDLKETKNTWLIFADADMVFDRFFFNKLAAMPKPDDKMTVIRRYSSTIEAGNNLIPTETYIDTPITKAAQKASIVCHKGSRMVGAGYFQMISANFVRNTGLIYATEGRDRKLNHARGPSYGSDKQLRSVIGLNCVSVAPAYHINHFRFRDHGSIVVCK